MELRHLRYFRAVAEELHFGRAAERLHIAQPPLSQQIRQLERELDVSLFIRSTRKVELTPAGHAYLKRAVAVLDAVDDAGQQARRIALGVEGQLTIGCVGSATYSLLPRLVRALRDELPHVEISVRGEMLAPAQLDALLAGDVDIALLRPPVEDSDIRCELLRRDRLIAALPADHPLASRDQLRHRRSSRRGLHRPCGAGALSDGRSARRSVCRRRVRSAGPPRGLRNLDAGDPGCGRPRGRGGTGTDG